MGEYSSGGDRIMSDPILEKANQAIEDFLDTDPHETDGKEYGRIYQKASMGMRLRHDATVGARIEIDQKLRAIGIAFNDPKVREQYTKLTLPKLLPDLKGKNNKD